ncbi:MAG: PDZ domain-containing protein [Candidatus Dehalobacter alkaniphilus]|uniref:PDZ domain-containing protein n=1 Tax=Dehalobacter sp. UNSWDHB TaxID=1339256 RepID=UPI00210F70C5|nr:MULTISPECIES: PDZ domain-containing protein [unclassified Dehalobacter]MDJ0304991.1 PDZ domain-containing protein [Dehalobacter sp.]
MTKIDNIPVQRSSDLIHEIYKHQVGDKISVTYLRNGKTSTISAILGQRGSNM